MLRARASSFAGGLVRCEFDGGALFAEAEDASLGQPVTLSLRPEKIGLVPPAEDGLAGRASEVVHLGTASQLAVRLDGGAMITARFQNSGRRTSVRPGERIGLRVEPGAARVLAV